MFEVGKGVVFYKHVGTGLPGKRCTGIVVSYDPIICYVLPTGLKKAIPILTEQLKEWNNER